MIFAWKTLEVRRWWFFGHVALACTYPCPDCVSKVGETSRCLHYSFRPCTCFVFSLSRVPVSIMLACIWCWSLDGNFSNKIFFSNESHFTFPYRDFAKTFSYNCIHQTTDPCDIKGKTEQATPIQLEFSQSCVKMTHEIWLEFRQSCVKFRSSERIQSAFCEDKLHEKRIIVVRRCLL